MRASWSRYLAKQNVNGQLYSCAVSRCTYTAVALVPCDMCGRQSICRRDCSSRSMQDADGEEQYDLRRIEMGSETLRGCPRHPRAACEPLADGRALPKSDQSTGHTATTGASKKPSLVFDVPSLVSWNEPNLSRRVLCMKPCPDCGSASFTVQRMKEGFQIDNHVVAMQSYLPSPPTIWEDTPKIVAIRDANTTCVAVDNLPFDIWALILSHLSIKSLCRLREVRLSIYHSP